MTQDTQHGLYAVGLEDVSTTVLGGITRQNVRTGSEVRSETRSNEVYPRFQALVAQRPVATFATSAIADALDEAGLTGLDLDSLLVGLHLYAQAGADGGTRASGAAHRKYTIADGLLIPRAITCDHQGDAEIDYEVVATYDGSNDPIVPADGVALPAGITDAERFTLGPVTLQGITFDHLTRFNLDFGIRARAEAADSDIWPTIVTIEEIMGVLRLRGKDPLWLSATKIPLQGKAVLHATTSVYLKKRASGGTFVADATAQHIKFTVDGLATIEEVFDAAGTATGETELALPLRFDGTNDPVVVNTASAIT
jgi:hypothetical protein